jgi:hypothetical protein
MRLLFKFRILAKQGLQFRIFSVHSHNVKTPHSNENDRIVKYNAKIFFTVVILAHSKALYVRIDFQ